MKNMKDVLSLLLVLQLFFCHSFASQDHDLHYHADFHEVMNNWKPKQVSEPASKPTSNVPKPPLTRMQLVMREIQKEADLQYGITHDDTEPEPEELFEGDIRLTLEQAEEMLRKMRASRNRPNRRRFKRKMSTSFTRKWGKIIAYIFDGTHSDYEKQMIRRALNVWSSETCIEFKETNAALSKLLFTRGRGCWSFIGYTQQKNQTVSIGADCIAVGRIAHEVGHALGLYHEQSRPDRDLYVHIEQDNIRRGRMYNFIKESWNDINTFEVQYDLGSIMHYGSNYYSKDSLSMNLSTVVPYEPLMKRVIGQRQRLSFLDVKIANKAYCRATCNNVKRLKCLRDGYQDPRDCSKCKCPDGFDGTICERIQLGSVRGGCGGTINTGRSGYIESPRYRYGYRFGDIKCTWLIKAPYGHRVTLKIMPRFGITCHEDLCTDYLEIRANVSMSQTGFRLCCNDPPSNKIYSKTNEIMLLFRTYADSQICLDDKSPWKCKSMNTGFKAYYNYEPCGGCGKTNKAKVEPCKFQTRKKCSFADSSCSNNYGVSRECNSSRRKIITRYCYVDMNYCCAGYTLNNAVCLRNDLYKKMMRKQIKKRKLIKKAKLEKKWLKKRQREKKRWRMMKNWKGSNKRPTWTKWTKWSTCDKKCGGDHKLKYRYCLKPKACGIRQEIRKQYCNIKPCFRTCSKNVNYNCGMNNKCRRKITTLCWPYCNRGYELNRTNGICQSFDTKIYKE